MSLFYVYAGIKHFSDTDYFLKITPPYFPYHQGLVYLSGAFELLFGVLLIFKKTRFLACWGLILLLIAVFPANIYLAQSSLAQSLLGITQETAIIRLPFQGLFILFAYWFTKK